jgi:phosphoribosyl-ATP pyrophosphohydrolase
MTSFTLDDLAARIRQRAGAEAGASYTRQLIESGTARIARKFGEESLELVIAALTQDREAVRNECADVLYHLLVLLQAREVPLGEVVDELERRTRQSGLEEKASRQPSA